ncbi:MAG TPA: hypothetical protein VGN11_08240, partial [Candidatus Baltobacteraceae bacterium]|nr:hypothetical protein [Candidatus Baltobacteraceae bacterium]
VDKLHRAGALGALWWCWADYAAELASFPPFDRAPHELHFGIVRSDGSYKPIARELERIAKQRRRVEPQPRPIVNELDYYATLPQGLHDLYSRYCANI